MQHDLLQKVLAAVARAYEEPEYIYDEIAEEPVIYVDGEPLAEYDGDVGDE